VEGEELTNCSPQPPFYAVPRDSIANLLRNRQADPGEPLVIREGLQRETTFMHTNTRTRANKVRALSQRVDAQRRDVRRTAACGPWRDVRRGHYDHPRCSSVQKSRDGASASGCWVGTYVSSEKPSLRLNERRPIIEYWVRGQRAF